MVNEKLGGAPPPVGVLSRGPGGPWGHVEKNRLFHPFKPFGEEGGRFKIDSMYFVGGAALGKSSRLVEATKKKGLKIWKTSIEKELRGPAGETVLGLGKERGPLLQKTRTLEA